MWSFSVYFASPFFALYFLRELRLSHGFAALGMLSAFADMLGMRFWGKISAQENKAWCLSAYNILGGLGAAMGPVLAGLLLKFIGQLDFQLFSWNLVPLHVIFIGSMLLRLLSFQILKYVSEPEEAPVGQILRVLQSVRGLSMAKGFNYLLHPFIEIWENSKSPDL